MTQRFPRTRGDRPAAGAAQGRFRQRLEQVQLHGAGGTASQLRGAVAKLRYQAGR